eukprot:3334238-Amphidinium_carterae.1
MPWDLELVLAGVDVDFVELFADRVAELQVVVFVLADSRTWTRFQCQGKMTLMCWMLRWNE